MTPPPAISVIVPVYNAESQIRRCLDSLHAQDFTDFETICIDDGSTDNSLALLHSHPLPHLRILSQPNRGQAAARNRALEIAQGRYICFVDADDSIPPNYLQTLHTTAEDTGADVIMLPTRYISPAGERDESIPCGEYTLFQDKIEAQPHGGPWNKIYRASLLREHKITFPEGHYWEDNLFLVKVCYHCHQLIATQGSVYHYIDNPQGTSQDSARAAKRKQDSLAIARMIMEFVQAHACTETEQSAVAHFCRHFIRQSDTADPAYVDELAAILHHPPFLSTMQARERRKRRRELKQRFFHQLFTLITLGIKS